MLAINILSNSYVLGGFMICGCGLSGCGEQ